MHITCGQVVVSVVVVSGHTGRRWMAGENIGGLGAMQVERGGSAGHDGRKVAITS